MCSLTFLTSMTKALQAARMYISIFSWIQHKWTPTFFRTFAVHSRQIDGSVITDTCKRKPKVQKPKYRSEVSNTMHFAILIASSLPSNRGKLL